MSLPMPPIATPASAVCGAGAFVRAVANHADRAALSLQSLVHATMREQKFRIQGIYACQACEVIHRLRAALCGPLGGRRKRGEKVADW